VTPAGPGLGTLLRHLIELLDGDLDRAYAALTLDYRPRYTPVVQILAVRGPCSIQEIARSARISHSATSQTVAQMATKGLVEVETGQDLRRRVVRLSPKSEQMLPVLRRQWRLAAAAAAALDAELPTPLTEVAKAAIEALERVPFGERMRIAGRPSKKTVPPPATHRESSRVGSR
jgi:DNA-binding MarR family transcriptional regulator